MKTRENIEEGATAEELVFGFVAAVGVDLSIAEEAAAEQLKSFGYDVIRIRVSTDVFPSIDKRANNNRRDYYQATTTLMNIGNEVRKTQKGKKGVPKYDAVALGIAKAIQDRRPNRGNNKKTAYLVRSLKHPHEVRSLRDIYQRGFYLIGVHAPHQTRLEYLMSVRKLSKDKAEALMERDKQEDIDYGQKLVDTFHLADVFFGLNDGKDATEKKRYRKLVRNNVCRFMEIVFGHPNRTPTFGEYAMFLAFSASLRSADLSRQVGAVVTREREILGAGANDCPKPGGGLYWPILNKNTLLFEDVPSGRDYTRGKDSNKHELIEIKKDILKKSRSAFSKILSGADKPGAPLAGSKQMGNLLTNALSEVLELSQIRDLTEFGRVVHAEMEALLSCARKGIPTIDSTLFSTTFPCHNCAKHIIAAGVKRVVFIEPYLKSKAHDMYKDDAIEISYSTPLESIGKSSYSKVRFEPFAGIGPRRFLDLFSMDLGIGGEMKRKQRNGKSRKWVAKTAKTRIEVDPFSYLDRESLASSRFDELTMQMRNIAT